MGSPYTTETTLDPSDEFLIVACDGVGPSSVIEIQTGEAHDVSSGTCAKTSRRSSSSARSRTPKRRPRDYSTTQ